MFDEVVKSIEQAKELPAVQKVYQSDFVKSKINQFEQNDLRYVGRENTSVPDVL